MKNKVSKDISDLLIEDPKSFTEKDLFKYIDYKARFKDIDVNYFKNSKEKIDRYCKNIGDYLEELGCNAVDITYRTAKTLQETKLSDSKTLLFENKTTPLPSENMAELTTTYYLLDPENKERQIGEISIILNEDIKEKKNKIIQKVAEESKNILEICLKEIETSDLSAEDPLTSIYNRRFFEKRLKEEFDSRDRRTEMTKDERTIFDILENHNELTDRELQKKYFLHKKNNEPDLLENTLRRFIDNNIVKRTYKKVRGNWAYRYYLDKIKKEEDLYVAIMDLDDFKDINDNYGGHTLGDEVLMTFSKILKDNIRTTDICARYGGEEFAVLFTRSKEKYSILETLETIRSYTENMTTLKNEEGMTRKVTISTGLSKIRTYDKTPQQIVKRADEALYRAKKRGKNQVVFYEDLIQP